MSSIVLQGISREFSNGFQLLNNLSVTFEDEVINFVVGRSGAGKTTLLQIMGGFTRPTSGSVTFAGIDVTSLNRKDLLRYRRLVGMVTQNASLVLGRTVYENVAMPLRILGLREADIRHRVDASLRVVGMADTKYFTPVRLSSGERQRVTIARAIVHRPKILLADEPTGDFDRELALDVLGLFDLFAERNTIVVVATHDLSLIRSTESIFQLENGAIKRLDSAGSNQ